MLKCSLCEVNMAMPETLECLSSLLEEEGSVCLYERGDYQTVPRHPDFRSSISPSASDPVGSNTSGSLSFIIFADSAADPDRVPGLFMLRQ